MHRLLVTFAMSVTLAVLLPTTASAAEKAPAFSDVQLEHFEKTIRPILVKRCYACHSGRAKSLKAGLRLDSLTNALKGGETGPAIVPGDPDKSLVLQAIRYTGDYKMPPSGKLPPAEIRLLRQWIRDGAAWTPGAAAEAEPRAHFDLAARRRDHWAWQPVRVRPPAAAPQHLAAWPRSAIDRYVLAKLTAHGLGPADEASRATWLRRVTYDLVGLPATPSEVEAFLADKTGQADERVVDRLLASRHFGEHWARHWLDLVRYAESRGHESDFVTPNAWEYRDYVIRAFNTDVPYDRFVVEHVAGDLVPQPRRHAKDKYNESILGTGFWFLGEWCHSPVDVLQDEADRFDNMIDVFGKTFLGLTLGCARCHDHKFDAISQKDYYALAGYLQSSGFRLVRYDTLEHNRGVARRLAVFRKRVRLRLLKFVLERITPGLKDFDAYLLASREVFQAGVEQLPVIAATRKLNVERLKRVVAHLVAAEKNRDDLLNGWARLSRGVKKETRGSFALALEPILNEWASRVATATGAFQAARVLVEFGKLTGPAWRQDGSGFRSGPVGPGDLVLSDNPGHPIATVRSRAAAAWDPAFSGLGLTGGTENENGRLKGWVRAGRTFRTPTLTLAGGKLWYLVSGAGHAFASVDSHRLLHGPLHGQTVTGWDKGKGRPRWVGHDLSRYRGHGVHIEFTPRGDSPLELYLVVEADRAPPDPFDGLPIRSLAATWVELKVESLAQAAGVTVGVIGGAIGATHTREGQLKLARHPSHAAVIDWTIRHADLFHDDPKASAAAVARLGGKLIAELKQLRGQVRKPSRLALAMWDGSAENQRLYIRGSHKHPGKFVPRRLLEALGGVPVDDAELGSGRLGLARQLVDPANPLVARVMVNRLWHHLFGRGLVPTVDNFGRQGQTPSHPRLLDWLADRFVRDGWSTKRMIRRMVLSRTYRLSTRTSERAMAADPTNTWLAGMRVRRLQGETIRDAMLRLSGRINPAYLGKSVPIYLSEHMIGRGRPRSGPFDGDRRRTIYIGVRRNFLSPLMLAFDTPQPFSTVGRRTRSNVPAQALILMNDPWVIAQSKHWARRLLGEKQLDTDGRIARVYLEAFARRPSRDEIQLSRTFLVQQGRRYGLNDQEGTSDLRAWSDLCHVMFNVKEFIFIN